MVQHANKVEFEYPFGEKLRDDIWSLHDKFQEFIFYRDEDMNLSLFLFYEFCTL
jgi:hypothetical protein